MPDIHARRPEESAHFELSFSPNVGLISTVRRFVSEFYVQTLNDADATSQLALATHELLDNAVVYSSDGNTSIRIGIRVEPGHVHVVVSTKNRATAANIASAKEALDTLIAAGDPHALFQELMRHTARRPSGSGLGLVRVRTESDMTMRYEIHGDVIQLHASADFKTAGGVA
jgi:hypothetical protein